MCLGNGFGGIGRMSCEGGRSENALIVALNAYERVNPHLEGQLNVKKGIKCHKLYSEIECLLGVKS